HRPRSPRARATPLSGLPARLNLTIPATALPQLANLNRRSGPWGFTPRESGSPPGTAAPPDGYGTWTLSTPDGRRFAVRLEPVPVYDCDHEHETPGYRPSDKLRHLVQVRDGTCTFPSCRR